MSIMCWRANELGPPIFSEEEELLDEEEELTNMFELTPVQLLLVDGDMSESDEISEPMSPMKPDA